MGKGDDLITFKVPKVEKIRSLNLLEPQGPAQACSGKTLPVTCRVIDSFNTTNSAFSYIILCVFFMVLKTNRYYYSTHPSIVCPLIKLFPLRYELIIDIFLSTPYISCMNLRIYMKHKTNLSYIHSTEKCSISHRKS